MHLSLLGDFLAKDKKNNVEKKKTENNFNTNNLNSKDTKRTAAKLRTENNMEKNKDLSNDAIISKNKINNSSSKEQKGKSGNKTVYFSIAIIIIIILALALIIMYLIPQYFGTSFNTFKANFNSAQRIAVVSQYTNASQYVILSQCSTDIISAETASDHRNASTIDFYVINSTTCTYAPNGLGHVLNPVTTNASSCEKQIQSEPSISLNYSNSNYTSITPYHMTIFGNDAYFLECPVAVGLT